MSGDVFGNGMLLSEHIKLVGAFNHEHIFIDPDPDPAVSFAERQRLFEMPRSSWADYDVALISKGGGVFRRAAKSIALSPRMKTLLGADRDEMAPEALVRGLLVAPVDLLWLGGIGTYIRASTERTEDAGDRGNDAVRVSASELRCKVIGEGANLGLTQRGRIEFGEHGGRVNTDAIDNSAGVELLGPRGEHQDRPGLGGRRGRNDGQAAQPVAEGHVRRGGGAGAASQLLADPSGHACRGSRTDALGRGVAHDPDPGAGGKPEPCARASAG